MLERLRISGFAVAREVELTPGPGLDVFTGETGAGKSLVVDALAFVFGARRGREVIAAGYERAAVEAVFRIGGDAVQLERSVGLSGRTTARRDGQPATVDDLQALAARAIDIHGQSEQLAILRPAVQLAVLDDYACLGGERAALAVLVRELRDVRRQLRALATDSRERERLIDQLTFEVDEITSAGLQPGEDKALRHEQARLANAGRLIAEATAALDALDAPAVGEAVRAAAAIVERDDAAAEVADLAALFETAGADLTRALRHYRDALEEDPERLLEVEERLDRIARLRRKYGETIDDVLAYAAGAAERLAALTGAGVSMDDLESREADLLARAAAAAGALSAARRAAAGQLVAAIAAELAHLGMGGASLAIGFACEDDPAGLVTALPDYEVIAASSPPGPSGDAHPRAFTDSGVDRVEFLASFNPGESPRPLGAIASGGETSRFLLALTTVLGSTAEPRIIVFDEVDEGVGGRAGGLVGEALARLAARHQVLCITHLPQVAAFGDRHFVVSKHTDGARSWSEIREAAAGDRIAELASMLGGPTPANLEAAREMLARARRA
ncbi:MAG: DNA repair protein RecN [Dehalococcoidia bacterium]|nr:DNA repair protein RecN [Dehalococcoidia bacterium]